MNMHEELVEIMEEESKEYADAYGKKPDDAYSSWNYLNSHPLFWNSNNEETEFMAQLDIYYAKVDPVTKESLEDHSKNTHTEVWLEAGRVEHRDEDPIYEGWIFREEDYYFTHDIDLDCGGDTFDEAIIELAKLVKKHYGHGRKKVTCDESH